VNIRRSLLYSYIDRYASLVVNIGSSMVIARLLTPGDIGTFSITVVLLTYVATLRDMGAGNYLVQERELTVERIRAVWAVQLGLGLLLALLVLAMSVPVALLYNEPRMRDILMVVALNYAINPFGSLTYAWQIREMRFDELTIARFTSTLAGALVSIFLAWKQMGPISLAFGSLATTVVNSLLAVYFRPAWFPWLPGLAEIRRVLAFGTRTTGVSMIDTLFGNMPELLLGKFHGMTATGLYSRANGLVTMFDKMVLSGMLTVALSWFAKQSREHNTIAQPFLKATAYVTALGWPFAIALIFLAHPVMRILYGPQWDGAVDITRILAFSFIVGLPAQMCISSLMALGRPGDVLRGMAITTALSLPLIAVGAYFGSHQLAAATILTSLLRMSYWLNAARQAVQFEWQALRKVLLQSATVGVGAGIGPALVALEFGFQSEMIWGTVLLGGVGAALGFLLAVYLSRHPLSEELMALRARFIGNLYLKK
jgi:O-antigen/teichoic acid export membrane protein